MRREHPSARAQLGPAVGVASGLRFALSEVCDVCEILARTKKPSPSPSHRWARPACSTRHGGALDAACPARSARRVLRAQPLGVLGVLGAPVMLAGAALAPRHCARGRTVTAALRTNEKELILGALD